jgi:hypothetical protein
MGARDETEAKFCDPISITSMIDFRPNFQSSPSMLLCEEFDTVADLDLVRRR